MNGRGQVMTMMPAEAISAQVVMSLWEVLFLAGVAWVWRELQRMGINGACQLGLGLLVLLRLSALISSINAATDKAMDWAWLTSTVFSFVFLYTLYHVGMLIRSYRG